MVGTYLLNKLAVMRDEFSFVGDVRGKGLMIGIELVHDKTTKTPFSSKHFEDIWEDCKDMGLLFGRGGLYANVRVFIVIFLISVQCITLHLCLFAQVIL